MNENEKSIAKIIGQTSNGVQVSATAGRSAIAIQRIIPILRICENKFFFILFSS